MWARQRRSTSHRRLCTSHRDRCTWLRLHRWWSCPAGMASGTTMGVAIGADTSGRRASTTTETVITMKAIATTAHRATPRRASADQSAGRLLTFGTAQVVVERKARYRTSGPQHLHPVAET